VGCACHVGYACPVGCVVYYPIGAVCYPTVVFYYLTGVIPAPLCHSVLDTESTVSPAITMAGFIVGCNREECFYFTPWQSRLASAGLVRRLCGGTADFCSSLPVLPVLLALRSPLFWAKQGA